MSQHGEIIQFIDTLSRFWIPIVLKDLSSQETVNVAIKEIFSRFGIPSKIVCDKGTNYKGFEFKNLCKSLGIEIHYCTPDHKTGNVISERSFRTMRTILMKIKAVADENATFNFTIAVHFASYIYNTTECTTTKISPFILMFGCYPNFNDFLNNGFQNSTVIKKLKS
uniref:Integrase catalytic domain-containing protein n=1 Tax=Strongyloides stercoralis TaxID=6248 RepID=A0A0K0ETC5_STRER